MAAARHFAWHLGDVSSIAQSRNLAPGQATATPAGGAAVIAGVCGLLANLAYILTASELAGDAATPIAAGLFGPLIAGASVALYLLLATERRTVAGLLAAIANVAAGALVTAMLLVQISVNDVESGLSPSVNDAFEHVEFGLDMAWDVFLVAGTALFSGAMLADQRFGRRFAVPGIVLATGLFVFNFATFPTPPEAAGLVDLGPLVGLWYAAVSVQALRSRAAPRPAHAAPAEAREDP